MDTERENQLTDRFDARLISLYSRGVQDHIPQGFNDVGQSYSFCYYDMIEVQRVEIRDGPVLKDAYLLAQTERGKRKAGLGSGRSLVAVMDIEPDGTSGYTRNDIDMFWSQEREFPLFFVSMLNLAKTEDLEDTLKEIKETFRDLPHLAYITFDHCDIILFCRGDSFQEYARHIFKLYYASEKGLGDAITLYSFLDCKRLPEKEERFATLIRVGVKDYLAREQFYEKLSKFEKDNKYETLSKYWLLERNDIGFYREDATLHWLMQVRNVVLDMERENGGKPWYTTYSLTVLIPDGTDGYQGWRNYDHLGKSQTANDLRERVDYLYKEFKEKYEAVHDRLRNQKTQVYCDQVFLRWLEESYHLVVSLMSSRLSEDLGVCLLPQFMDMFIYGSRLFSEPEAITRNDLERAQKSFGDFFSNIAVLVDSMNQTDRQFVQVPAFHLPSFNIPPQIMAFYTVIVRKMLAVLRDDNKDIFYGFTIAPKLVNTLSVFSLSIQDIPQKDEWISMNMDEMSFYTLRLTMETIAHEVSHYIGEDLRKRKVRKEAMIKCAFQLLLGELARRFAAEVDERAESAYQEKLTKNKLKLYLDDLDHAAEELWKQVQELDPNWYGAESNHYSCQMKAVIQQIPRDIESDWALADSVIKQVWIVIQTACARGRDTLLDRLQFYIQWNLGMQGGQLSGDAQKTLDVIMENEASSILGTIIDDLMEELDVLFEQPPEQTDKESTTKLWRQLDYLCYMFRETFADLQAILLLDMQWGDYCGLLLQGKEQPGVDHAPRMFAVTKALLNCGVWKLNDIGTGGVFTNVQNALVLDPVKDADRLAKEHKIPPELSGYLFKYLAECTQDIRDFFTKERHSEVEELQTIHKNLPDHSSFLTLQKTILRLTEDYWRHLLE